MTITAKTWHPATPLQLKLAPAHSSVALARRYVRHHLASLGGEIAENAALIASELVTNAIVHAAESPAWLYLRPRRTSATVEVWDASVYLPQPSCADDGEELSESGRGLVITRAVAALWGSYLAPGGGKVVYALVGPEPMDLAGPPASSRPRLPIVHRP